MNTRTLIYGNIFVEGIIRNAELFFVIPLDMFQFCKEKNIIFEKENLNSEGSFFKLRVVSQSLKIGGIHFLIDDSELFYINGDPDSIMEFKLRY